MPNNRRPTGASYYTESADERFRFIAWGPPPSTGNRLCLGVTGRRISLFGTFWTGGTITFWERRQIENF